MLDHKVAQRNWYPTLDVTAGLYTAGSPLRQMLSNPIGSAGLALLLPMLDWQSRRFERRSAQLDADDAMITFEEKLYRALGEVEMSVASRNSLESELQAARDTLTTADRSMQWMQLRYDNGAVLAQKIGEQRTVRRDAAKTLLDTRLKLWLNYVAIRKALGGPIASPAPESSAASR